MSEKEHSITNCWLASSQCQQCSLSTRQHSTISTEKGTPVRTGLNGGTPNLQSSKAAAIDPGSKASMVMW